MPLIWYLIVLIHNRNHRKKGNFRRQAEMHNAYIQQYMQRNRLNGTSYFIYPIKIKKKRGQINRSASSILNIFFDIFLTIMMIIIFIIRIASHVTININRNFTSFFNMKFKLSSWHSWIIMIINMNRRFRTIFSLKSFIFKFEIKHLKRLFWNVLKCRICKKTHWERQRRIDNCTKIICILYVLKEWDRSINYLR